MTSVQAMSIHVHFNIALGLYLKACDLLIIEKRICVSKGKIFAAKAMSKTVSPWHRFKYDIGQ